MSRLLTPAELEALRAGEPFVPAPTETFHVAVEAGSAELTPEEVKALEPGSVVRLASEEAGLAAVVVNGVVVAYGRLDSKKGSIVITRLAQRDGAGARPKGGLA